MRQLFKKYFQSTLAPDEFGTFYEYLIREENTSSVSKFLKPEWEYFLADQNARKDNPDLLMSILKQIHTEEATASVRKLKTYRITLRIAAVLVLGTIVTSIWLFQFSQLSRENSTIQTVTIPDGAKSQFILPDGSKVDLNSGTKIFYSTDFLRKRELTLVGEAFFDVVKGEVPFEVNTSWGTIRVLGTAFNVEAYPNSGLVTTLEKGVVQISDKGDIRKEVIYPGEQIRVNQDTIIKMKVNTELFTSWKDGKLIFSKELFPNLIKRLERWYNVKIEYSASDFDGLWFSGTIEGETATEVMEMICKTAPVSYTYNTQKRLIRISARQGS